MHLTIHLKPTLDVNKRAREPPWCEKDLENPCADNDQGDVLHIIYFLQYIFLIIADFFIMLQLALQILFTTDAIHMWHWWRTVYYTGVLF